MIPLLSIRRDGGTQLRSRLNTEKRDEYAQLMADGVVFPPVKIVADPVGNLWLWDGFTRVSATEQLGLTEIAAIVTPGSLTDALWLATTANAEAGQQRTHAEKWRATVKALQHPNAVGKSLREMGAHVGVSHTFVATVQAAMKRGQFEAPSDHTPRAPRRSKQAPLRQVQHWWMNAPDSDRRAMREWILSQADMEQPT
jgi:hypothetical protein